MFCYKLLKFFFSSANCSIFSKLKSPIRASPIGSCTESNLSVEHENMMVGYLVLCNILSLIM